MSPAVVRALPFLVLLGASTTHAATATASAPAAPLTAQPNPDGSRSLHWDLRGTSDSINILPHLRCALDPSRSGPFAGEPVPCIWLVDHKAPAVPGPESCPPTANPYASWRCDMRAFRDLTVEAASAGESSLIMFNAKSAGGSGLCAWIPVAVLLGPGGGEVRAADGCRERIVCAEGYAGTVEADALDLVTGCRRTTRTGVSGPVGSGSTASGTSPGDLDLSTCAGAGSGRKGNSPLYSVDVRARGRRGMDVRVRTRRAVPIVVEVRIEGRSGAKAVRSVARCARAGTNRVVFPDATRGASVRRRYRVVVRSPNSTYPLRSAFETLPRR